MTPPLSDPTLNTFDTAAWSAVIVAIFALGVSIWSIRHSRHTANKLAQDAALTRIHELLIDPKAAGGRRKLFLAAAANKFPAPGDEDWDQINYSLALYDTLGGYIRHGFVDAELALQLWHEPLQRIEQPAKAFASNRSTPGTNLPWSFLWELLERSNRYSRSGSAVISRQANPIISEPSNEE